MIEIGLGVALFTGLILCLVVVILAIRAKLVATGAVVITVNDDGLIVGHVEDGQIANDPDTTLVGDLGFIARTVWPASISQKT